MTTDSSASAAVDTHALWAFDYNGHDPISTRTLGFWLYMLSDAMIFATLFAAWAVYIHNSAGGPTIHAIVHLHYAFWETAVLFSSVFAYGLAMTALKRAWRGGVLLAMSAAFAFGVLFLGMEIHEFSGLAMMGAVPQRSGFLSAYWTIILLHGAHIFFGLLWMLIMLGQIVRQGFSANVVYRLLNLKLFWHFQAVIWVCVYTFVYLRGAI